MEPPTTSFGVIPEKSLKLWSAFRNVGAAGEEILKTAKLAHAANYELGFVVTKTDETYCFFPENINPGRYVCKVSKIQELSGIRVKGTVHTYTF